MTNHNQDICQPRRILRLPEVLARLGMGRSWLFAEVAAGRFPKPVKIGRASGWDSLAIDTYIDALIANAGNEVD